jgi:hypothetical protein
VCNLGWCTAPPREVECDPFDPLDTRCTGTELCIEDVGPDDEFRTRCIEMPACGPAGECPPGVAGAVCNEGLLPGKERICLASFCLVETDCPQGFRCLDTTQVLGLCSSGGFGSPCITNPDCTSGRCITFIPGEVGFCG